MIYPLIVTNNTRYFGNNSNFKAKSSIISIFSFNFSEIPKFIHPLYLKFAKDNKFTITFEAVPKAKKNNCLFLVSMNNFFKGSVGRKNIFFYSEFFLISLLTGQCIPCPLLKNVFSLILRYCLTKIAITLLEIVRFSIQ